MDIKIDVNININGTSTNVDFTEVMSLLKGLVTNQKEAAPVAVTAPATIDAPIMKDDSPEKKEDNSSNEMQAKPKTASHRHLFKVLKKLSEQNINDLLTAAELVDDTYDGKNISYLAFCAKTIKTSGVPLCSINSLKRAIGDRFDFQYYHRNKQQNTPELCREAAILLYSGVTVGVATIITEQCLEAASFDYVVNLTKNGFTQDELNAVYKKYKKELLVYNIDRLVHDEHWLDNITNNRTIKYQKQKRLKYTPDQVGRLVYAYEDAINDGLTGQRAVYAASKKVNVVGTLSTLKRALFDHKSIPGYQHIKTPVEVRSNTDMRSATKIADVRTVKFLYQKRGFSHERIARELGMAKQTVARICSGLSYSQVVVDAETEKVLEHQYPMEMS